MGRDFLQGGDWILVVLIVLGAVPDIAASWQFLLVAGHYWRNDYQHCAPVFPRTAILIPAWNEAAVIGASIDRLMALEYPRDALRVYLVDDASTDETPQIAQAKAAQYPGNVFHLRREQGGQGKAHTLNHGPAIILQDDWMQALLITDADVIFISPLVVYLAGYGSLLCACTFVSYVKELRGAEMKWDKTEKTGKVTIP
ncbi:MAG TPA: glycosyltransferase family 2 protein, partial [Streptosporangiaceae bacterium]|nr:glycosyltransferase family 2 protein [Streptosporangiaceae bacterium]